jgi:hypothetical protein
MYTFVKDVIFCNICVPNVGGFVEPNVIAERALQPTNAYSPMDITVVGIIMVANCVQP